MNCRVEGCPDPVFVKARMLCQRHYGRLMQTGRLGPPERLREFHGRHSSNDRTYVSWQHMRQRCLNPNNDSYSRYGGRGITICKRWDSFVNFLEDMGERPLDMTLDRKDSSGNYEPDNCQWATPKTQARH